MSAAPATSPTPDAAGQDSASKPYAYPATEIFKIVMHVDGRLLDVEPPEGAKPLGDCPEARVTDVLSTLQYALAQCPSCVLPRRCACVTMGAVRRCWCR